MIGYSLITKATTARVRPPVVVVTGNRIRTDRRTFALPAPTINAEERKELLLVDAGCRSAALVSA
jgi:hypothetical protein